MQTRAIGLWLGEIADYAEITRTTLITAHISADAQNLKFKDPIGLRIQDTDFGRKKSKIPDPTFRKIENHDHFLKVGRESQNLFPSAAYER